MAFCVTPNMVNRIEILDLDGECASVSPCTHWVLIRLNSGDSREVALVSHEIAVLIQTIAKEKLVTHPWENAHFIDFYDAVSWKYHTGNESLPTAEAILTKVFLKQ